MNFILILFLTVASCAILPSYGKAYVTLSKGPEFNNRNKRDIGIHKNNDDKYAINFNKDLINDGDKKLSVYGMLEGLDRNSYDSIRTGFDFKNSNGDSLDLSAITNKQENKISGEGELNVFKTDKQSLLAKIFGEKDILDKDSLHKFGGTLDYINKNGNSLSLTGLNTNEGNKYSALGHLNLLNTGKQSLDVGAYGEKISNTIGEHNKFGGSLDYINKNGHNLFLTAKQDSDLGKELAAKGKYTIIDNPNYSFDAQGYWNKNIPKINSPIESYGASLNYLNGNGDKATLLAKHTSDFGNELAVNGNYNIFHNNNHNLDLTGKLARVIPSDSKIGGYNDYSANLNYLYKDKLTANLGVEHSGLSDRTDLSALGKLNLVNDKNTHLDIFGGVSRSMSPKIDSGFQPNFGVELSTDF